MYPQPFGQFVLEGTDLASRSSQQWEMLVLLGFERNMFLFTTILLAAAAILCVLRAHHKGDMRDLERDYSSSKTSRHNIINT
jgi:hypothetical protein